MLHTDHVQRDGAVGARIVRRVDRLITAERRTPSAASVPELLASVRRDVSG